MVPLPSLNYCNTLVAYFGGQFFKLSSRKKSAPPSLRDGTPNFFLAKHSRRFSFFFKRAGETIFNHKGGFMSNKSATTQRIKSYRENKNLFCSSCWEFRKHFIYKIALGLGKECLHCGRKEIYKEDNK